MKRVLIIAIAFVTANEASAWEGYCRPQSVVASRNEIGVLSSDSTLSSELTKSMCEVDVDTLPRCTGYQAARGILLGEHTAITASAMERALLPAGTREPVRLRYYSDGTNVSGATDPTFRPADAGAMKTLVEREFFLEELSELGDLSHSFSDFLLGNEHCFIGNIKTGRFRDLEACHQFEGHMGPINSTHWGPLAEHVYAKYHAHALDIAARCNSLQRAIETAQYPHPLFDEMSKRVTECVREALAFEAFGLHYLEDAWSSGHMWDRWGSPHVAPTQEGQLRAFLATAIVGLTHGTRSLFGYHDQMCMPGRFEPDEDDEPFVQYAHSKGGVRPGGGDMYLHSCDGASGENAIDNTVNFTGAPGERQYDGMIDCAALGASEIYRAGPPVLGDAGAQFERRYDSPSDSCFDQRVTNESMRLGLGSRIKAPGYPDLTIDAFDIAHPGFFSRMYIGGVIELATDMGVENLDLSADGLDLETIRDELRVDITRLATRLIFIARERPESTQVATGSAYGLSELVGVKLSSSYVDDVQGDGVPYYERVDRKNWNITPGADCNRDAQCSAGEICDLTSTELLPNNGGLRVRPRCVRHEVGVLRAFRNAEILHWCKADGEAELSRAREGCKAAGGAGVACDACVEMLLPHVRNGCGPDAGGEDTRDGIDRRSMCEALGAESPSIVFAPYLNGDPASLERAAHALCRGEGRQVLTGGLSHDRVASERPTDEVIVAHGPFVSRQSSVCGASLRSLWFRIHHDGSNDAHTHEYGVRAYPDASKIAIDLFHGPACEESDRFEPTGVRMVDKDGDGTAEIMIVGEDVPARTVKDICVRVRGATEEVNMLEVQFALIPGLL